MPSQLITDKWLRKEVKPGGAVVDYWDTSLKGFAVRIGSSGAKSFFVGTRINGKYCRITIGQYPKVTLADARKKAGGIITDAGAGISPETKEKRTKRGTFKAVCDDFMADHAKNHRTRHEMQRKIDVELKAWHDRPIASITRGEIKELLREKARGLERGVAANRLLALISKIFAWALDEEIIDSSPALRLKRPAKEIERERVATADEIHRLWRAYNHYGYPHGAHAKMMLLTGQRFNEVASMKWSDITDDGWRLPAAASKTGLGHLVPLSTLAREVLAGVPQIGTYVFRVLKDKPLRSSSKQNARLYWRAKITDWQPEDARRTCATFMRSIGIDRLVVSKLLNHAEGGITKVYDRWAADPEKADAVERWANKLREIIGDDPASTVTQLKRSA